MNGTPRLRTGAFPPPTPQSVNRRSNGTSSRLPDISAIKKTKAATASPVPADGPLIPTDVIDAATQRLLVVSFYIILWLWRLYDFKTLLWSGENESLWLFMKWVSIDSVVLFGLPALRIPWLEFSSPTITIIFLGHVLFDMCLMFQVGLPVRMWFWALVKVLYDRETSISDRRVKPSELYRDDYLLSGKHIIHILPEGSAYLNPKQDSFCIGGGINHIDLPIQINQTTPISMELLRQDLDTQDTETVAISSAALKKSRKTALQAQKHHDPALPLTLTFPVKKAGIYTIQKIVDESKLEVRPRKSQVVVVQCPQARVLPTNANKCRGELSDIAIEVVGTPPMKVKYRRMVNSNPVEASFQSIQPDDLQSPYARNQQALVAKDELSDASWARARRVIVPINETLATSGSWWYAVDEVQDALGNVVSYGAQIEGYERARGKMADSQQLFAVHDRPIISLRGHGDRGCDSQHPLKVAFGERELLPLKFSSERKGPILDTVHHVEYQFTSQEFLLSDGEHNPDASKLLKHDFKNARDMLYISESGLYSLVSVSTPYCAGEVEEPASCLLRNPPRPEVDFQRFDIKDKCQDSPVGLRLSLDLVGSPPFTIDYTISKKGARGVEQKSHTINGLRGQLQLMPMDAGHYTYNFYQITDRFYKGTKISQQYEQVVKPAASAHFEASSLSQPFCLNEKASFQVKLGGEGPWKLNYEIIHGGQRIKVEKADIAYENFIIETEQLESGGDYTISITSVEAGGCAEDLKEEVNFSVRYQKPRAFFNLLDGKRSVHTLEAKSLGLPVGLTGEKPWTIEAKDGSGSHVKRVVWNENYKLEATSRGTYEILAVHDKHCPGVVDEETSKFTVDWIERPAVRILDDPTMNIEGKKHIKEAVCEGDEDSVDLVFTGNAPFDLSYEEHAKPDQGAKYMRKKGIHAALSAASIQLETSKAGTYEYKFVELSDQNYDHNSRRFTPLNLQQRVYSRPTARFTQPGKTYNLCSTQDTSEETIPITLTGVPPFHIEVEIKNVGSSRPDVLNLPNVPSLTHALKIPQKYLRDGQSFISIRKVRDSRGCESSPADSTANSPRVQVAVHDAPTITSLESYDDYCVGDYVTFRLSGSPPFQIYYTFKGKARQATSDSHNFRRIIDEPGAFKIEAISDAASECRSKVSNIDKSFHPKPRGSVSKGRDTRKDIHEGGEDELQFDFVGTPPFEFSYIRKSEGRKGQVLETKTEKTDQKSVSRMVNAEGEYELVSLRDKYCLTAKQRSGGGKDKKLLTN